MADDPRWAAMVDELKDWVVPSWTRNAAEHGDQPWVRLVLLVDAHAALCNPQPTEKIAMTMADLAEGRDEHKAGWEAIVSSARDERLAVTAKIVDEAPQLLPGELMPYFERSVEPTSHWTS
jgi:hypothetical protein